MRVDAPAARITALTIYRSVEPSAFKAGQPTWNATALAGRERPVVAFSFFHHGPAHAAAPRARNHRRRFADVIPAAFDYFRAHTTDEAFAHLQQHGAEARVLAGGQSLIPAMRFRLARPAVLVDINSLKELSAIRVDGKVLAIGAIARDADIERAAWITDRRWSLIHDVSRVVADPVVRQMGTLVGSLCHNDPAGDWTAAALASRATVVVRGKAGTRRVPIDDFLVDSFTTAVGDGEMALG